MENLRKLRKMRGMTMKELGLRVGVSEASISFYETGKQFPGVETLRKIADVLGVSVDALLGRDMESDPSSVPQTAEARIISSGIDQLPKEQREQALNVMRAMFSRHIFDKEGLEDDTKL